MSNRYLKKEILSFNDLKKIKKVRKLFDFLFLIDNISNAEKYNEFINMWDENEKNYSFFKREQFDYSKIKDSYFLNFDEKTKSYIVWNEFGKTSFSTFDALWENFDSKQFNVVFYCYDFQNISKSIKSFFEKTWFINTNKKFVQENQWKYIFYKNKINGFFLKRCTVKNNEAKKWEMFFIPSEDINLLDSNNYIVENVKNYDLYEIALTILIKFIVAIYSKNNENVEKFISELNESKSNIHNKKVINEFDQKVKSLFTNRSESKCMKSIIWISIIEWNNRIRFIEEWSINEDVKLNNNIFFKYMDRNFDKLSEGIIEELLRSKREFISILGSNEISDRNVELLPEFNCGFKKCEVEQTSFAIFNNNLFNIYFDEEWKFRNRYLFDALCFYLFNNIKANRDQEAYKIDKVRILNPRHMRWAEINIDRLDKFIKENFKTDLHSIQSELRKMLNGE